MLYVVRLRPDVNDDDLDSSAILRLFPLREPGVNYMASELTKKEIEVSRPRKTAGL